VTFGRELDAARRARGLTYRELAERAGCSHTYLVDLARGNRGHRPSDDLIGRVAAALEVDPAIFAVYRQARVLEHPDLVDRAYALLARNGDAA
jgi:transcriptional regulator with XRE-family HTH domain